jgi:hypothetical protein
MLCALAAFGSKLQHRKITSKTGVHRFLKFIIYLLGKLKKISCIKLQAETCLEVPQEIGKLSLVV